MAYAPLDEKFDDHPKYIEYGAAEMGLIACGITYCNRNLTDGVIPRSWPARRFGADIQVTIEVLLRDGVWVRRIDGAYEVVGFLDHNRSKAEILAIKTRKIEAGKLGGRKSAESRSGAQAPAQAPASAGGQAHGQAGAQVSAEPISTPSPRHSTPTSQTDPKEPPPTGVQGGTNGVHKTMTSLPLSEKRLNGPLWIEHYQAAATKALDRKWVFPKAQLHDLLDLIGVHCSDKTRIELWIDAVVPAFVSATKNDKPTHWSSHGPRGLAKWLNEGGGIKKSSSGSGYGKNIIGGKVKGEPANG